MLKRTIVMLLLLGSTAVFMLPVCAMRNDPSAPMIENEGKQRLPKPNWDLKYSSGSLELKKEQWLKAAFMSGSIPEAGNNPVITISIDELSEVYFNPRNERDSDTMQHMSRSGCNYAKNLMPKDSHAHPPKNFVAWVKSPVAMRRAAEHLSARYPVRFVWSDHGSNKEITFSVSSCEYASFLANLRWLSGQRWKDIEREFPQ